MSKLLFFYTIKVYRSFKWTQENTLMCRAFTKSDFHYMIMDKKIHDNNIILISIETVKKEIMLLVKFIIIIIVYFGFSV